MSAVRNILVVDGQGAIRFILKGMLEQLHHTAHLAGSVKEALQIIGSPSDIDLVLCDSHLEDMNGLDVHKTCQEFAPNLPVVLMSTDPKDTLVVEALKLGALDYLVKPFEITELKQVIARIKQKTDKPAQRLRHIDLVSRLEMSFHSTSRQLSVRRLQAVVKHSLQLYTRLPENDLLNISLALEEAILNAHEHGNLELLSVWKEEYIDGFETTRFDTTKTERLKIAEYADRKLNVQLTIRPDKIAVTVDDGGEGYSADSGRGDSEIKPHGMGLMLINNLMDGVRFEKDGSSITFEKKVYREE